MIYTRDVSIPFVLVSGPIYLIEFPICEPQGAGRRLLREQFREEVVLSAVVGWTIDRGQLKGGFGFQKCDCGRQIEFPHGNLRGTKHFYISLQREYFFSYSLCLFFKTV